MPKLTVQKDGTTVSEKRTVDFVEGDGMTITATEDSDQIHLQFDVVPSVAAGHPNLASHDALGLATDIELANQNPGWVNVMSSAYGAEGDSTMTGGGTDDTAAINAAAAAANAIRVAGPNGVNLGVLYFPPGKVYRITAPLDTWTCRVLGTGATILYDPADPSAGTAVTLGDGGTHTVIWQEQHLPDIRKKTKYWAEGVTGTDTGLKVYGVLHSSIYIGNIYNFSVGLESVGGAGDGYNAYLDWFIQTLHDNKVNLLIRTNGSGTVNSEQNFFGGAYRHNSGSGSDITDCHLIKIVWTSGLGDQPNNIHWWGTTLESNATEPGKTIVTDGTKCFWHDCRWEKTTGDSFQSGIVFRGPADTGKSVGSDENFIDGGFWAHRLKVTNAGANTRNLRWTIERGWEVAGYSATPADVWTQFTRHSHLSPENVGGLKAWVKADAIEGLSDGDAVETWYNQANQNSLFGQQTVANKPLFKTNILNGYPAVRFDGSASYMKWQEDLPSGLFKTLIPSPTSGYTTFIVWVPRGDPNQTYHPLLAQLFGLAGTTGSGTFVSTEHEDMFWWETGDQHYARATHAYVVGTAEQIATRHVPGDKGYLYINGVEAANAAAAAAYDVGTTQTQIGRSTFSTTPRYLNGDLVEIIVYDRPLSVLETYEVSRYLADKYALTQPVHPDVVAAAGNFPTYAGTPTDVLFPAATVGSAVVDTTAHKLWLRFAANDWRSVEVS